MVNKGIEITKRQIMDILQRFSYEDTNNMWVNKLADLMLKEYGKSKTTYKPALDALEKAGIIEKYKLGRTENYPQRIYIRIVENEVLERIKNGKKNIENTRKIFLESLRYLKKHGLFEHFGLKYEHETIYKKQHYVFINDKPTWKKGEKVPQFNNPEFLKSKLVKTKPFALNVYFKKKSLDCFYSMLEAIEFQFNHCNSMQINLTLGYFDKLYETAIKSQIKESLIQIQKLITKLIESFSDDLQRDYIDQYIKRRFAWQIPLMQ